MSTLNRFSVHPLASMTRLLADVASARREPDLVIRDARMLSTYSERILPGREIWLSGGRIAAVKPTGSYKGTSAKIYDAKGGILAPGLVDPHIHIESSMVTACAYAEAALLNGTTTIFCDSHEIGNVMDVAGVEAMLEDARVAPLSIFLTVPSTVPATSPELETAGGDLTPDKIAALFDKWPEAVALGEKMDFVPVAMGDERSHAILAAALSRGRPVSGHVYGREFVAAYAASGVTDTHEAIDRDIADDLLQHVLDRHQTRHTAVFVDHDGHVVVVGAEFTQQHVQTLGLGNEGRRTQQVFHIVRATVFLEDQRQQVLGQQHAEDIVVAFADHRIARVRRIDDGWQEFTRALAGLDADHLRARHHDVAHLQVGDLNGAFDNRQRFAVQQLVLMGFAQQLKQLLAVFRLMGKCLGQFAQP